MRQDMARLKNIPRSGSEAKSKKTALKIGKDQLDLDDHGPVRLSSSRYRQYGYEGKQSGENYGPIKRFLRSCVGRSWNKIYSVLRNGLDSRTFSGQRILEHVAREVTLECQLVDGKVVTLGHNRWRQFDGEVTGLYVHPVSGILCYKHKKAYLGGLGNSKFIRALRKLEIPESKISDGGSANFRIIDSMTILERINGCWFMHSYAMHDPEEIVSSFSLMKSEICYVRRATLGGSLIYPSKTHQLSKKELKQYKEVIAGDPH